ncbi:site-specific integrase [Catellatospora sp. NPDC049609]|uniref:site-specific integrase n=1 Tax=Catellatospora sp. NPDC049609 TaxID=3155505 RepID=UPI00341EF93B
MTDRLRPVWTLEEANTFLAYVRRDRLYVLWRLLVVTGLRRGELAGLKWVEFDPMTGTIRIIRQRVVEGEDSAVREKRPKSSNSIRSVMLDRETAAMLGRMRPVGGSPYMFSDQTNMPLRPDNITDRFNKLSAAAGVRQIGPHQIRHMLVSSLLEPHRRTPTTRKPTHSSTGDKQRTTPPITSETRRSAGPPVLARRVSG